ncbi:two-component system sensor histidine kinase CreC [Chitinivorax sp. B]|uniref:two-component system sensor histidine kinase CreC n=1 Tax=Chitinivorax sp. B TaxID=2502235 RepID=UPI0010F8D866|nr:two-component system sensor histidine kinase CreC [Chitinivorax sp. B]
MLTRNHIGLGVLLVYLCSVGLLLRYLIADLDPRYREATEASLVDTSYLLASLLEHDASGGQLDLERLQAGMQSLNAKQFQATIFAATKTQAHLRVYVTDQRGKVLFDSQGKAAGQDYSRWRDVARTLHGQYGARTTSDTIGDKATDILYVSAPIVINRQIVGVVSTGKPVSSFGPFVDHARQRILSYGLIVVLTVLAMVVLLLVWFAKPFGLFMEYVRHIRTQRNLSLPRLGRRTLGLIGAVYQEIQNALAGRHYIAEYVQTLTHEIKSPLSVIRGTAALLREPMPVEQQARFLENITRESQRIQELVDRMLELTELETKPGLESTQSVNLASLVRDAVHAIQPLAQQRGIQISMPHQPDALVDGDPFLLQRAIANLLANAVDFSPTNGIITVYLSLDHQQVRLAISDQGTGIPDYAADKIFQKFYSLPRPHTQRKSTGLGLAFVREIADLHQGRISLHNHPDGGAEALLQLPLHRQSTRS